jgi:tetratricopeptide (TPR) repeat protein
MFARRALVAVVLAACGGSKPHDPQPLPVDLTKHLPVTLEADHAKTGEPRSVHVRVWADADVRALPHWKDDITEQIDYASQLITPMLGAKLVVDDIKDWARTGDVHDALTQLAQVDDAHDVTWAIGYVSPNDKVNKAFSELGDARLLGHHVVVRAWAEKPETDALDPTLPKLAPAQRAEVMTAHRRHKQTVVLLHELATTLGAIAAADPTWVEHPLYSPKQSKFAAKNRELMQLAIDERLTGGDDKTLAHDLLEAVLKQDWGGWVPNEHEDALTVLRKAVDAAKAGKTAADIPAAASDQFDRIRELEKHGEQQEAIIELDNLLIAYPANATLAEEKCEIMLVKPGVADAKTRDSCARVAALAPGDPTVHFAVGEALAKTGDLAATHAELEQAATKIANLTLGQGDAWRRLIGIYAALGAVTWTEQALEASHLEHDPAAAVAAQIRARYGLVRGAKFVQPAAEPALVAAIKDVLSAGNAQKYGDAEHQLAVAERKWPGAPGLAAARCDVLFRQGAVDAARDACQRALAHAPDESWALYLSGVIALRDSSASGTKRGIDLLKRAIAADSELGQAWRALAKAYDRIHDQTSLDQLATDYQTKFSSPLPR